MRRIYWKIKNFARELCNRDYKYVYTRSKVYLNQNCHIAKNVRITNSTIRVDRNSTLYIDENVSISNLCLNITNSNVYIGKHCSFENIIMESIESDIQIGDWNIFERGCSSLNPRLVISRGKLEINTHNRIRCDIFVRFGGKLGIGSYTNINEGSEIRCDECIDIGDHNQISYDCNIWDTNTHNMYTVEKRRELTEKHYPSFGLEYERPITKPVYIGNDCWIGKYVIILKGTTIGNSSIVGIRTLVTGYHIKANSIIVNKIENLIYNRTDI